MLKRYILLLTLITCWRVATTEDKCVSVALYETTTYNFGDTIKLECTMLENITGLEKVFWLAPNSSDKAMVTVTPGEPGNNASFVYDDDYKTKVNSYYEEPSRWILEINKVNAEFAGDVTCKVESAPPCNGTSTKYNVPFRK